MSTIGERITLVRTDAGLTMTAFAERLNLSKSSISLAESDKSKLSKRVILDICEKFNVNPEWLKTGEGKPYNDAKTPVLKLLKAEYKLDDMDIEMIENYLQLKPIERQVFKDYIQGTSKKIRNADQRSQLPDM